MTDLTPGPELDALFFSKAEGLSVRLVQGMEFTQDRDWAQPGDYVIDDPDNNVARLCPAISEDDSEALAALERFAEKHGIRWIMTRAPGRYGVRLIGKGMPRYAKTAPTLAMAIVRALLAAVES